MKAIVMNGAGDIDMLEYVERPDPSQPAQPAQPAQQSSPRSPGSRSAGGRQGGRGAAGGWDGVKRGFLFPILPRSWKRRRPSARGRMDPRAHLNRYVLAAAGPLW